MITLEQQLIDAVRHGPSDLNHWLDEHAAELTPEIAIKAHEIFRQALASQQISLAANAAFGAAMTFLRLGKRYEALSNYLDYYQIYFMSAGKTEDYAFVHEGVSHIIKLALEIGAKDLVFNASTMAADSAYFSSEVEKETKTKQAWLLKALMDLVTASGNAGQSSSPVWFERFVSLLCGVVSEATSLYWLDDERAEVEKCLHQLALGSEVLVPVDFMFSDKSNRSDMAAHSLSYLSYKYGTPAVANGRLSHVIKRADETRDVETWMDAVFALYKGMWDSDSPKFQLTELRKSLKEQADRFRLRYRSRGGRLWVNQELNRIFGELLKDEFGEADADSSELFKAVETVKARTLLDQMCVDFQQLPSADLVGKATEIERQLLSFNPQDTGDILTSEMRLTSMLPIGTEWDRDERTQILRSIEGLYGAYKAGFQNVEPIPRLDDVRGALQPGEALIEYCIPHHALHPAIELWIMVITQEGMKLIPVPLEGLPSMGMIGRMNINGKQPMDIDPLGELVIEMRVAIHKGDDAKAKTVLNLLYRLLISPLFKIGLKLEDYHQWIVVPHGMLHYIPFAALMNDNGHHLIEDIALTVVPSASVWFKLHGYKRQAVSSFLGFANPLLPDRKLPPLIYAEKELDSISRILKGIKCVVYKGKDATESTLRTQIKNKDIIHLATHGEFPEDNAIDFHRVLLSPTAEHDGRVNAEEFLKMDLHKARLVVLSICNGGLYRFGPGDEPYGLISALLTAGAENVLGTLWPLEDQIGQLFMAEFYKYLLEKGPGEALRQACMQFIKDQALISQWSGFVLIGPGRPLN